MPKLLVAVETKLRPVGCPVCGVQAVSKGRRTTLVRDLEIAGRPSVLVWRKRRISCKGPRLPEKDLERGDRRHCPECCTHRPGENLDEGGGGAAAVVHVAAIPCGAP